jgi:hypothetical protein
MSIILNRNWVNSLLISLPEYAQALGNRLDTTIKNSTLSATEIHSCALSCAIAAGYGELAFEISMSDELRGNDIREDIARVVINMTIDNVSRDSFTDLNIIATPYTLAVAIMYKNSHRIDQIKVALQEQGYTDDQLNDISKIASLILPIGKCIL